MQILSLCLKPTLPLCLSFRQVRLLTESTQPTRSSLEEDGSYGPTIHPRRVGRTAVDLNGATSGSTPITEEIASAILVSNKIPSNDDGIAGGLLHPVSKVLLLEQCDFL